MELTQLKVVSDSVDGLMERLFDPNVDKFSLFTMLAQLRNMFSKPNYALVKLIDPKSNILDEEDALNYFNAIQKNNLVYKVDTLDNSDINLISSIYQDWDIKYVNTSNIHSVPTQSVTLVTDFIKNSFSDDNSTEEKDHKLNGIKRVLSFALKNSFIPGIGISVPDILSVTLDNNIYSKLSSVMDESKVNVTSLPEFKSKLQMKDPFISYINDNYNVNLLAIGEEKIKLLVNRHIKKSNNELSQALLKDQYFEELLNLCLTIITKFK